MNPDTLTDEECLSQRWDWRVDAVNEKIEGFGRLPVGWDYGSGGPSTEAAMRTAQHLTRLLSLAGATHIDAVPGIEGGVSLLATLAHEPCLEVCVSAGGAIEAMYGDNDLQHNVAISQPGCES